MQLIAYGAQDIYLTGNPQITFFKTVYRRHTNFSMEYIPQNFDSQPQVSTTQTTVVKYKIKRNADLLYDLIVAYDLPPIYCEASIGVGPSLRRERFEWIEDIGQRIINKVEIFVGGQLLDRQYSTWMNVWTELTLTETDKQKYNHMIGNRNGIFQDIPLAHYLGGLPATPTPTPSINASRLYIPLNFWFCQNPGLAIPLISLQYTELELHVTFNPLNELFTLGDTKASPSGIFQQQYDPDSLYTALTALGYNEQSIFWRYINGGTSHGSWNENTFLLLNYIYLDETERRRFAKSSVEYLITQTNRVQVNGLSGIVNEELRFQHPVKELIFVLRRSDVQYRNAWTNYTDLIDTDIPNMATADFTAAQISYDQDLSYQTDPNIFNNLYNILYSGTLRFNGHERFGRRSDIFFDFAQPFRHHRGSGKEGIYVYSFSLKADDYQPSGSCNFSRITKAKLELQLKNPQTSSSVTPPESYNYNYTYDLEIYSHSFNVFRIMSGIGDIVFSN